MKTPINSIPMKTPFHSYINRFICQSIRQSIHHHISVCSKPLKIPGNNGEKHAVNYLHEIMVKSPSVHTLYGTSVVAPICASSIQHIHTPCVTSVIAPVCGLPFLSICLTNNEHQEFPDEFHSTNYGEKLLSKITAKIPDNITLTLHQVGMG